jgi:hypothetical protein
VTRHPGRSDHVFEVIGLLETVLGDEMQVVTLVEDLAPDVGVVFLQLLDLLVLLGHELLVHRGDLDEEVVVGKVEVGREELGRLPITETDGEATGLVFPGNAIEIKEEGELTLAVVGEVDLVGSGAGCGQGAPISTTPARSDSSGNNW